MSRPPIDQAIAQNERYIDRTDRQMQRAATRVTFAADPRWAARWLAALGTFAQRRENAVFLLNGLKAVRHRPELAVPRRRPLKVALRRREPERKRA